MSKPIANRDEKIACAPTASTLKKFVETVLSPESWTWADFFRYGTAYTPGRPKRSLVGSVDPSASPFTRKFLTPVLLYAQPRDKVGGVGTYDKRKSHTLD